MARRAGYAMAPSTICTALNADTAPAWVLSARSSLAVAAAKQTSSSSFWHGAASGSIPPASSREHGGSRRLAVGRVHARLLGGNNASRYGICDSAGRRGGPAVLLVLFIGLLGLVCGADRRRNVMNLSSQAMEMIRHWPGGCDAAAVGTSS